MAYWVNEDIQHVLSRWRHLQKHGHIEPAEHQNALEQLSRAVEIELRTLYPVPPSRAVFSGSVGGGAALPRGIATASAGSDRRAGGANARRAASSLQGGI